LVLVVGSTGMVGGETACMLAAKGIIVRGLVRSTSDPAKIARLSDAHITITRGDLRDPASLSEACRGVETIYNRA